MKIILDGKINRTYVQSLCMAFFHGIKFPKIEEESTDALELYVKAEKTNNGVLTFARLSLNGAFAEKELLYSPSNLETEERAFKTAVGQAVYAVCKQIRKKDIEWGILTGIRPSKVCAEILSYASEKETEKILIEKYLLTPEKADLAIKIAKNETQIMSLTSNDKCSVYISIPFCPSRCNYCSFISYAGKKLFDLIPAYVEKIILDIKETFSLIKELNLQISCIYIGGGTPTMLNEAQLEAVLGAINGCVNTDSLDEFTLEGGRPDTITDKKLEIAKKYGVNRISVNPQTLNDEVLKEIGRNHTVSDFLTAYKSVRASSIKSVNTDLIAGLDKDTFESFKGTVDQIIALNPDNVTVHTFCVKKSARILHENEDIYNSDALNAQVSVNYAYKALTEHGYIPYYMYRQKNTVGNLENIGYAKQGFFGLYNVFMMSDAHTVFGIGAGATTKLVKNNGDKTEILRIFSQKYPYEYLRDNQKTYEQIKEFFDRR